MKSENSDSAFNGLQAPAQLLVPHEFAGKGVLYVLGGFYKSDICRFRAMTLLLYCPIGCKLASLIYAV